VFSVSPIYIATEEIQENGNQRANVWRLSMLFIMLGFGLTIFIWASLKYGANKLLDLTL